MRVFDEFGLRSGRSRGRLAAATAFFALSFFNVFGGFPELRAQSLPDFSKPLAVCRIIPSDEVVAADSGIMIVRRGQVLIAYEAAGQTELWRSEIARRGESALLDDQDLFIETIGDDDRRVIVAISRATGLELWRTAPNGERRTIAASNLAGVFLFDQAGHLTALDRRTGAASWSTQIGSGALTLDAAEPLTATGANGVVRIAADGRIESQSNFQSGNPVVFAAVGAMSVFGYADGTLAAYDSAGRRRWSYKFGGRVSFLLGSGRGIVAGSFDNFIYLFDPATGRQLWKKRVGGRIVEKPLIAGEIVIAADSGSSNLTFVELKSGKAVNSFGVGDERFVTGQLRLTSGKLMIPVNGAAVVVAPDCK